MNCKENGRSIIKQKGESKSDTIEKKLDLGGGYPFPNMHRARIDSEKEVAQILLGEFKIQEDVKMSVQFPDYDDFRGSDFPNEADLASISMRGYGGYAQPSRPTLKRHLFMAHIPKKSFNALKNLRMGDKKGEFNQDRLFRRVAEIHISRTRNELSEMDFVDGCEEGDFPQIQDTSPRYYTIAFRNEEDKGTNS